MGYIMAQLAPKEIHDVAYTYANRFLIALAAPGLVRELENTTSFEELADKLGHALVKLVNESYTPQAHDGTFPPELIQEIQGMADGMRAVNASTDVTFERLITVNYGFDMVSVLAYTGNFTSSLLRALEEMGEHQLVATLQRAMLKLGHRKLFKEPAACNAFGASGSATVWAGAMEGLWKHQKYVQGFACGPHVFFKSCTHNSCSPPFSFQPSGTGAIFARDFQLVTCDIFQNANAIIIFSPTDGRNALAAAAAPGMTGSITAMNQYGVAMGVDTLRSAAGNPARPGLNSLLLVRHVADYAQNTSQALQVIAAAKRGCPWLYPLCDGAGDCAIVEGLGHTTNMSAADFNPLRFLQNMEDGLRKTLPSAEFIRQHANSATWLNGAFARRKNYQYPQDYLSYNPALYQLVGEPYNASAFAPNASMFATFQQERAVQGRLQNKYFNPPRYLPDAVVVSNFALVPDARITQMNVESDLLQALGGSDLQYRFDVLTKEVANAHGQIDLDKAKDLILFLAPDRTPGYWNDTLIPGNPMSAQIEGSITVADLVAREMHVKGGYYTDDWIGIHLPQYL